MIAISTHAEWHPLREVVLGTATGAQVPTAKDASLHAVCYGDLSDEAFARVRTGPFPRRIVEETNEDLEEFARILTGLGIRVHRPAAADFSRHGETRDWRVDGYYGYCPRDTVLTIGEQAIETPMALRHRHDEARILRHLMRTVAAPRPRLLDEIYDRSALGRPTLRNSEPVFDAANCLKFGRDVLFLISNTGNHAGAQWLQQHLGPEYRVHTVEDVYSFVHIDSTFVLLRPGLLLLCPERVTEARIPAVFKGWDRLYCPEPNPLAFEPEWRGASKWIAMNVLSLRPDLVAVEQSQSNLMRALARHGIESVPVPLRHMRALGGGPHCVALDLVREGQLEDYTR